jgi:tRNA-splicing ligase RtcB
MRVPARVFADRELLDAIRADRSLEQLRNVATLPGITGAALAMPDVHQGYGFPVGGVAATAPPDGVISPGGVGYDINCGVRLWPCRSTKRSWARKTDGAGAPDLALGPRRMMGRHGRLECAGRSSTGC